MGSTLSIRNMQIQHIILIAFGLQTTLSVPPKRLQQSSSNGIQYVAYTGYTNAPKETHGPVYVHQIINNDTQVPQKYTTPFSARSPYLAFNTELNRLEVAGDRWSYKINKHYLPNLDTGGFEPVSFYFQGRTMGAMVYTKELGTLIISGQSSSGTTDSVINVTPPANFESAIAIPNLNIARKYHMARYYNGVVYVVGGTKTIEIMSTTSGSLSWIELAPMATSWSNGAIQLVDSTLFVVGNDNKNIEVYDVDSQTTTASYSSAFSSSNANPGSFIVNGTLTVFGGFYRQSTSGNSFQSEAPITDVSSFTNVFSTQLGINCPPRTHLTYCDW